MNVNMVKLSIQGLELQRVSMPLDLIDGTRDAPLAHPEGRRALAASGPDPVFRRLQPGFYPQVS